MTTEPEEQLINNPRVAKLTEEKLEDLINLLKLVKETIRAEDSV